MKFGQNQALLNGENVPAFIEDYGTNDDYELEDLDNEKLYIIEISERLFRNDRFALKHIPGHHSPKTGRPLAPERGYKSPGVLRTLFPQTFGNNITETILEGELTDLEEAHDYLNYSD